MARDPSTLTGDLARALGDPARVSANATVLEQHAGDFSYHPRRPPDAVVFAESRRDVEVVLRFASERGIPVTPFGAGTSLEGHVIPVRGGIVLDLSRMNRILEVRPADFLARVEPGVTRLQLNRRLEREGLFFSVDPGADASLGGMAATNASGTNTVRYGAMRDNVLGLEVVLADGRVVRTGSLAVKSSAGYNLTALFVGSEGTLGVITEVAVRVRPLPEAVLAARAVFPTLDAAAAVAVGLIASGVPVARVELVDPLTIRAVNRFKGTAYPEAPTLFLEFHGSEAAVAAEAEYAERLAREEGASEFHRETDPKAREKLWEARHHAALAVGATDPRKRQMVTDVCVPISLLPEALRAGREAMAREGVEGAIMGHVGDGNYHAVFMVDPEDPADVARARRVNDAIVDFALAHGGTCTGEHGVGLGKRAYLAREHGDLLELMAAVKRAFDPRGILNPGKVLSEAGEDPLGRPAPLGPAGREP